MFKKKILGLATILFGTIIAVRFQTLSGIVRETTRVELRDVLKK